MKSVLLSIKPQWCELIASGKKTVEVRKTKPKIETPFKCYIYQSGKVLTKTLYGSQFSKNGYVIGEFVCDKIYNCDADRVGIFDKDTTKHLYSAFLSWQEIFIYTKGKLPLYGWHISDLKIYDKPKELGEFKHCGTNYHFNPTITRPPQSWCYVEELK